MIPDDLLVKHAKAGDINSFSQLVERHQKQVYNLAFRFTGNSEDAADLAQEAFIKAYRGLKTFREEAAFKTWIYHITSNVCKDFLRKTKSVTLVSIEAPIQTEEGELEKQIADDSKSPEEIYEGKELAILMQKLIDSLPIDYREVILLREFQQLSYEEIAQVLDCSLGTVKSRLNRARRSLKNKVLQLKEHSQLELRQIN